MSNFNPNNGRSSDFQSLLNTKFSFYEQYSTKELASFLDRAADTISRYRDGRLTISADTARDIIRFVAEKNPDDKDFINFFCKPAGLVPVPVNQGKLFALRDRKDHELGLSMLTGEIQRQIEGAYADKRVNVAEYKKISKTIARLIQEAKELEEHVKQDAK